MNTLRNGLKSNYSQIPNEIITDLNLCNGSMRVLLYLFTKPDSWNVYNKDICKRLDISEQTLTKYWKILIKSGWLKREISKNKDGKLTGGYDYLIGNFTVSIESTESVNSIEHSNNKLLKKEETNNKQLAHKANNNKLYNEYLASKETTKNEESLILDYLVYRKDIKKPITTIRPLNTYYKIIVDLHTKGYDIKKCIDLMKNNEWQKIDIEWIKNSGLKSSIVSNEWSAR